MVLKNLSLASPIEFYKFFAFQILPSLIGGFLFGYNTGVISGALLSMEYVNHLSVITQEVIVGITIIAAVVGAIIGGVLAERYGRKLTLIISSVFMMFGAITMGMSLQKHLTFLEVGRGVIGIGIGMSSTVCPIYIAEVSPMEIRGRVIVLYQIMIAGGQFIAALVNAIFYSFSMDSVWRITLGIPFIPAFIQAAVLIFIPESHRWLLSNNKIQEAKRIILLEGRVSEDLIDDYVDDILLGYEEIEVSIKNGKVKKFNVFFNILRNKQARSSLFLGCGVQLVGQMVGINGIIYYSTTIITNTNISKAQDVLWYTSLVMFFCFVPVLIAYFLIDRIGRRKLALWGLVGTFIGCMIMATGFQLMYYKSDPVFNKTITLNQSQDIHCYNKINCEDCVTIQTCGFCSVNKSVETYCLAFNLDNSNHSIDGQCSSKNMINTKTTFQTGSCSPEYSSIVIIGMAIYLLSYAAGMGPVPWVITSEIYPYWCRGFCMAMSTTVNWAFNLLIIMTFLSITEWITRFGVFWLLAGFSLCGFVAIYRWLPETADISLEKIPLIP